MARPRPTIVGAAIPVTIEGNGVRALISYEKTKLVREARELDVVDYLKSGSPPIEIFLQIEALRRLMHASAYEWWMFMIEAYTNSRAFSDFESNVLDESKYARTVESDASLSAHGGANLLWGRQRFRPYRSS